MTNPRPSPANRLGLDYRAVPRRKLAGPIVDVHTHVNDAASAKLFFDAARAYGITRVYSMTPVDQAPALRDAYGDEIQFIAIPRWRDFAVTPEFRRRWIDDISAFQRLGARLCKFWMAPPMRERHGLTLEHEFLRPVIEHVLALGLDVMVHVGDPSVWWEPGGKYADTAKFGTKAEQYPQLEWLADRVAPRRVIAAHMGGCVESPDFLAGLLARYANLFLDSSATKWIVREVARRPVAVREFMLGHAGRVLFGSDLVTSSQYNEFDHYASRYWAHLQMWDTGYRGESPIDDPDAQPTPMLAGLDLPEDVLKALYVGNAQRLGLYP